MRSRRRVVIPLYAEADWTTFRPANRPAQRPALGPAQYSAIGSTVGPAQQAAQLSALFQPNKSHRAALKAAHWPAEPATLEETLVTADFTALGSAVRPAQCATHKPAIEPAQRATYRPSLFAAQRAAHRPALDSAHLGAVLSHWATVQAAK